MTLKSGLGIEFVQGIQAFLLKPYLYLFPVGLIKQQLSVRLGPKMQFFEKQAKAASTGFAITNIFCLALLALHLSGSQSDARAVLLTQNFEPGSAAAFAQVLSSDVDTVILDVSGGYLTEGIEIGRIIRAQRLRTVVPEGGSCLSACAEAFLGGVNYRIDGVLAFHVPRMERLGSSKQAFDVGFAGGTLSAMYRYEMGFGFDLTKAINKWTTANRLLVFKNTSELFAYKSGRSTPQLPILIDYRR